MADLERIKLEAEKMRIETEKLRAETVKIQKESKSHPWLPIVISIIALIAAIASPIVTALVANLLKS